MTSQRNQAPFLWVALDRLAKDDTQTFQLARELDRVPGHFGFKINLDAVLKYGIGKIKTHLPPRPIFADLKMWNGASTMARVFTELHREGITATNAYALAGGLPEHGGELLQAISIFRQSVEDSWRFRIYAVTLLTHYDANYCVRIFGRPIENVVTALAGEGLAAGADAVIIPGTFLSAVDHLPWIQKVLPGIRPDWYEDSRHVQEIRPEDVAGRNDVEVVCGSPITKSINPLDSLNRVLGALKL